MSIVASLAISTISLANSIMFEQSAFAVDNCDATATCINEQFGSGTGDSQVNNCSNNFCLNRLSGNDNTQTNNCRDGSACINEAFGGDRNTQTNNCVVGDPCINRASGNDNSQNINCTGRGGQCADNSAVGDNNVQNMECNVAFISFCENSISGDDNAQKVECIDFSVEIGCSNTSFGDGNTQDLKCYRSSCINRSGDPQTGPTNSNTQNTLCANSNSCLNNGINTNVIANGASECQSDSADTTTVCQPGRRIVTPNS
jgi:hypothetical protein